MNMTLFDIEKLKFDDKGLIPAVVVDNTTREVLMVAYMNKESLLLTLEKKKACFFSRSRNKLWLKGETSGNFQNVVSITADCDYDTLKVVVDPDGPACHEGDMSCFHNPLYINEDKNDFTLSDLYKLIEGRKTEKKEGSYTSYLFEKGLDKILKKVGEESTEVIIAAAEKDRKETVYEIGDLVYHVLVLMVEEGIPLSDVVNELSSRHVIDHKIKQEKMTS